jgi:putative glutamine amidotransferase
MRDRTVENPAAMDQQTYHFPVTLPRVGLTTYREPAAWGVWNESADLLPAVYANSISGAGAVALLLPPAAADVDGAAGSVLDGLHGLVLTGGADVDPAHYLAERDSRTGPPRPDRDAWELRLAHCALDRGTPVLAICRGMQVLNVALGGDLVQHLPEVVDNESHRPVVGQHGRHDVSFAIPSRLGTMFGPGATVATYHHQSVQRVAEDLVPTGWAADGTVEAVEHRDAEWVVGVQWHPEAHGGAPLFEAFVAAAARYRAALPTTTS